MDFAELRDAERPKFLRRIAALGEVGEGPARFLEHSKDAVRFFDVVVLADVAMDVLDVPFGRSDSRTSNVMASRGFFETAGVSNPRVAEPGGARAGLKSSRAHG